jgi:hypothetical protein
MTLSENIQIYDARTGGNLKIPGSIGKQRPSVKEK